MVKKPVSFTSEKPELNKSNSKGECLSGGAKIAITGGAGTGKTSVCKRLEGLGVEVIYSDILAREVVEPGMPALNELVQVFGGGIVDKGGELDRAFLRKIMVSDEGAREKIEGIVQSRIVTLMQSRLEEALAAGRYVVVEIPLLFELGLEEGFDIIITVDVGYELQVERVMSRDSVSRSEAEALLALQFPREAKLSKSQIVIDNSGAIEDTLKQVDLIFGKLFGGSC